MRAAFLLFAVLAFPVLGNDGPDDAARIVQHAKTGKPAPVPGEKGREPAILKPTCTDASGTVHGNGDPGLGSCLVDAERREREGSQAKEGDKRGVGIELFRIDTE